MAAVNPICVTCGKAIRDAVTLWVDRKSYHVTCAQTSSYQGISVEERLANAEGWNRELTEQLEERERQLAQMGGYLQTALRGLPWGAFIGAMHSDGTVKEAMRLHRELFPEDPS